MNNAIVILRAEASNAEVGSQDLLLQATTAKDSYLLAAMVSSPSSVRARAPKELVFCFLELCPRTRLAMTHL
jgi:hypothetical protein